MLSKGNCFFFSKYEVCVSNMQNPQKIKVFVVTVVNYL